MEKNKKEKCVLIATGIYPPDIGGPAYYIKNIKERLRAEDYRVTVITYSDKSKNREDEIIRINRKVFLPLRYWKFFWEIFKRVDSVGIIYAHDLISSGLPSATVKLFKKKTKLVLRLGGDFLWEKAYNHGWTNKPLRLYYQDKKNIREKIYLIIYKFVLNKADKIIFSTEWQREIYNNFFGLKSDKTVVIENAFPSVKKSESGRGENIIFAGRLIKIKNVEIVIKAVCEIEKIKFDIIGDGPEFARIKKTIVDLGLEDKVRLKPKVDQAELINIINQAYCVIVPSVSEVSPNIVLECIKLGKPVLVTKECGYYEKFKGKLIFLDPFETEDIKAKIRCILDEESYQSYVKELTLIDSSRDYFDVVKEHKILFNNLI